MVKHPVAESYDEGRLFRLRKCIVVVLGNLAVAAFVAALLLFVWWCEYSPTDPRTDTGEIYPLEQHGDVFYVTRVQHRVFAGLLASFAVLGVAAAFLNVRWNAIKRAYDNVPPKFY